MKEIPEILLEYKDWSNDNRTQIAFDLFLTRIVYCGQRTYSITTQLNPNIGYGEHNIARLNIKNADPSFIYSIIFKTLYYFLNILDNNINRTFFKRNKYFLFLHIIDNEIEYTQEHDSHIEKLQINPNNLKKSLANSLIQYWELYFEDNNSYIDNFLNEELYKYPLEPLNQELYEENEKVKVKYDNDNCWSYETTFFGIDLITFVKSHLLNKIYSKDSELLTKVLIKSIVDQCIAECLGVLEKFHEKIDLEWKYDCKYFLYLKTNPNDEIIDSKIVTPSQPTREYGIYLDYSEWWSEGIFFPDDPGYE